MSSKAFTVGVVIIILAGLAYFIVGTTKPATETQPDTTSQNGAGVGGEINTYDPVMVGTWKSTEDAKFTRTFRADGTVTDAYAGDASATEMGTYTTVDPLSEPAGAFGAAPASSLTGMTVIKVTWPKTGVMYFGVQSLTETDLKMVNISGRGNILSFTKVQ